jgi:hypothetical protein
MRKHIKTSALLAVSCIALFGLSGCSGVMNPAMTDGILDDRNEVKATLVFREFKSSLYLLEYGGKKYLHNSNGGIVEIK